MKWNEIVPVVISVIVIILVAVLQKYNKLFAAVVATMPLTFPLALWVVYASSDGDRYAVEEFASSLMLGLVPTVAFAVAVWLASRAGFKLIPMLVVGYSVWGVVLVCLVWIKRLLGW